MSVISWDDLDNLDVHLSEKQLESVYVVSLLGCDEDSEVRFFEVNIRIVKSVFKRTERQCNWHHIFIHGYGH